MICYAGVCTAWLLHLMEQVTAGWEQLRGAAAIQAVYDIWCHSIIGISVHIVISIIELHWIFRNLIMPWYYRRLLEQTSVCENIWIKSTGF